MNHSRSTTCAIVVLALSLLSCSAFAEERRGMLVLGSYLNQEYANDAQQEILAHSDLALQIVTTSVRGVKYYRLVTDTLSETQARDVRRALPVDYHSAWFLPVAKTNQRVAPASTPVIQKSAAGHKTAKAAAPSTAPSIPKTQNETAPSPPDVQLASTSDNGPSRITYLPEADIKLDGHID